MIISIKFYLSWTKEISYRQTINNWNISSLFENKLSYKDYSSDKSGMTRSNGDVFSATKTLYQLDQKNLKHGLNII
jgi:hypothetical protein